MRLVTSFVFFAVTGSALALGVGVACSSSSGGGGSQQAPTVTKHITAAAGGTVADSAGTASLAIPPGALGADTDITLTTDAAETGTVTSVYDFGPTGTTFSTPASLVINVPSSVSIPSGQTPTLATYDGTKWAAITGSTFTGGKVTGPVAHFSKYTVILSGGQVVVTNSCSSTVTSFVPCGGNVVGTWAFTDVCTANGSAGTDPTDGGCPGALLTASITPSGTITFNADGSYSETGLSLALDYNLTLPTSCLGTKTCDPASLNIFNDAGTESCSTTGANCVCDDTQNQTQAAKSGTYVVSSNTLATDNGTPGNYCITGSTLVAQSNNSSGQLSSVFVLTKQ